MAKCGRRGRLTRAGARLIAATIDKLTKLADEPVHDLPMSREGPQGPNLVHAHQTRVALHVGREDGREASLDPLVSWVHGFS